MVYARIGFVDLLLQLGELIVKLRHLLRDTLGIFHQHAYCALDRLRVLRGEVSLVERAEECETRGFLLVGGCLLLEKG